MEPIRLIDQMFSDIRAKGLRAIAKSDDAYVRTELLALMESVNVYELKIHAALNNEGVSSVLLKEGEPITEEIISKLEGQETRIITYRTDDNSSKNMEH